MISYKTSHVAIPSSDIPAPSCPNKRTQLSGSCADSNCFDPALKGIDPSSADYFKLEVPDPYNQSDEAYETTLAMVERAVDGLLDELKS